MGREFELKYAADQAALEILKGRYPNLRVISMETAYYDTPERKLSARRWTLRRRRENGASICTLKTPLPDGSRGEWEVEAPHIEKGIGDLCACGAPRELAVLTAPGVIQICGARFTRLAATIELEKSTVELALDSGALLGGGRELPFTEVEVELKSGDETAAVAFAQALAAEFGLKAEAKSKYRRALDLAKGDT
ncbi:MAG: CYTH domain-containing protein [Oscillospiraceae bacterium]|nr:CYTH domain-containing protein [Oscillospiraceae bacterium]